MTAWTLSRPCLLEMVGELDDQDSVLGDQADERDQADLAVDVERREPEKREEERAGERERDRSGENDERIPEALELSREHEVDQDRRQQERSEELASLGADLAGLARVVDGESLGQDLLRLGLEHVSA